MSKNINKNVYFGRTVLKKEIKVKKNMKFFF